MCTVTFLPSPDSQFILTSSRDETINRLPSSQPTTIKFEHLNLLAPIDEKAGGTWIAAAENGRLVCLLNGAFEKHEVTPPYRKSRGKVVLESFLHEEIKDFYLNYNFDHIEPFTLVMVEKEKKQLFEFRWDGERPHLKELPFNKPAIWSSATLYTKTIANQREEWFNNWLNTYPSSAKNIKKMHLEGGEGSKENTFRMQRDKGMQTVSITQVISDINGFTMHHDNFATHELNSAQLTSKSVSLAE